MKAAFCCLALLSLLATPAWSDSVPMTRIQEVFERKIKNTEQMVKICKSLQACGQPMKDAAMETIIMRDKYTSAGGKDSSLLSRADAAINEAGQLAK